MEPGRALATTVLPQPAVLAAPPRRAEIRALSPASYSLRVTLSADAHAKLRKAQDLLRHQVPNGDPAAIVDRALTLLVEQLERVKFAKPNKNRRAVKQREVTKSQAATGPVEEAKPRKPECSAGSPEPAKSTRRQEEAPRSEVSASASGEEKHGRRPPRQTGNARRPRGIPAEVRREVWARDHGRCAFVGVSGRCTETGMLEFHHRVPFADGGGATPANIELRCRGHNQHEAETWERSAPPW